MAKQKKRGKPKTPPTKNKPTQRDWTGILINSLIDLLIGTLLVIISRILED